MASATTATTPRAEANSIADQKANHARPDVRRFLMLAAPLALLLYVFKIYYLEQPAFFTLTSIAFGGFAIHYWLPFRLKQPFLIALSLAGSYWIVSPAAATLSIAGGLAMFAVVRAPLSYRWRVLGVGAIFALFVYGRIAGLARIPTDAWAVFGSLFMFRIMIYLYDMKYERGPASLTDYLSYFFMLPNYYFLLFPIVDFQTFRKSYYKRDIHVVAQQGLRWIVIGTGQLLLYRLFYLLQDKVGPPAVPVGVAVPARMILCYLLILRIIAGFHIAVGILCLYGFDLPNTTYFYLLASSFNDYWRRANIYWKDFMLKMFYLPMYYRLRKSGDLRAHILSAVLVFIATWFLHAYQAFWLQGEFHSSVNDTLYWAIIGAAVTLEIWATAKRRKRLVQTGWGVKLRHGLQVAGMQVFMTILWSMWSSPSLSAWRNFLSTGN